MKGILKIIESTNEDYNIIDTKNEYIIECYLPSELLAEKINHNNPKLKGKILEKYIELLESKTITTKFHQLVYNYLKNDHNLLDEFTDIILDLDDDNSINRFLISNPQLLNKRIMINKQYDINSFEYIKETFKNIPNLYLNVHGNKEFISINDYQKTTTIINDIITKIKQYNFSPIEQIMYAYDLIRERIYKQESTNESYNISRDLTKVLLGDKIVCAGYANIFEQVLIGLGIKNQQINLFNTNNKKSHVRNVAYIKDKKYNLNGIYYFDLTWASKTNPEDNSYLKSYKYFAKTKQEIDKYSNNKYKDNTFLALSENLISKLKEILKDNKLNELNSYIVYSINEISRFIYDKDVLDLRLIFEIDDIKTKARKTLNKEEIIKELNEYENLFNNPIPIDKLLTILFNVRKVQYYENPEKYNFSFLEFETIAYNSHWKFDENSTYYFNNVLFETVPVIAKNFKNSMYEYSQKVNLNQQINQIRLIKTLSKIKDKKTNSIRK